MLTKKQKSYFDYITKFIEKHGYAPSVEETKKHFRVASKATAHQHIQALVESGYLTKLNYKARGISIIQDAPSLTSAEIYTPLYCESIGDSQPKYDDINKFLNKIICGDAAAVLKKIPPQTIDIVITSPPYDKIRTYNGHNKFNLHETGREIFRVLKDGGMAVMVIQDQTKNFGKTLTSFRTTLDWCDNIGFKLF